MCGLGSDSEPSEVPVNEFDEPFSSEGTLPGEGPLGWMLSLWRPLEEAVGVSHEAS